jgi:hypothetical protein
MPIWIYPNLLSDASGSLVCQNGFKEDCMLNC